VNERAPRAADPRLYQITVLAALLAYGLLWLGFDQSVRCVVLIVGAALATQYAWTRLRRLPAFDPRSALISALSLSLLLRTNDDLVALAAAALAVTSKFVLRWGDKHVSNPTNVAIVAMLLLTDRVWVSPGQWGSLAVVGFLMGGAGCLVVTRARRADVTLAFLAAYAALLVARSLWLGEPWRIPLHRLESGALVLFAFFMISDPKTTPDSRAGRMLFAALIAAGAYTVQFAWFRTNGLLWSLALFSLAVPMIDWLLPGSRYRWPAPTRKGDAHESVVETTPDSPGRGGGRRPLRAGRPRLLRVLRGQG
jgi:Na+-transporting NADH:ubiquinone oxidoreductase subunit NqrB